MSVDHYLNKEYDIKERFASYWHQINEILSLNSKKILEVGIGGGIVSSYLRIRGKQITTLDTDKNLSPNVVGSVTEIPFSNQSFEYVLFAVCCCSLFDLFILLIFNHFLSKFLIYRFD